MKKIIAAAVAASMSAVAMADISITGNANYEYFSKTEGGAVESTTSDADMEVNLSVVGKTGDTTVVANLELTGASTSANSGRDSDGESSAIDVEDLYITTKVGDLNIKAGDFASGTTALGGEIDNGGRAVNKVDISTKVGPATIGYAVNSNSATDDEVTAVEPVDADAPEISRLATTEVSPVLPTTDKFTSISASLVVDSVAPPTVLAKYS